MIVGGDTPLMKRFAHAFVGEWIAARRQPAAALFRFDRDADGADRALRRELSDGRPSTRSLLAMDGARRGAGQDLTSARVPAYASGR